MSGTPTNRRANQRALSSSDVQAIPRDRPGVQPLNRWTDAVGWAGPADQRRSPSWGQRSPRLPAEGLAAMRPAAPLLAPQRERRSTAPGSSGQRGAGPARSVGPAVAAAPTRA